MHPVPPLDRRSVIHGAVWSVPVVTLATSSPAFARSTPASCTLVSAASSWTVDPTLQPLRPHATPGRLETGWMNSTSGVTTTGATGDKVTGSHGNSMETNTSHKPLPAGSFISWQDAGGHAVDGTATQKTVLTVDYRFIVKGEGQITISNEAIFQYGNPATATSRQTLMVELMEETSAASPGVPAVTGPALLTKKVAAARQKPSTNGTGLVVYPTSEDHPVSHLLDTDADLVAQGFELIQDVPSSGRYARKFNLPQHTLNVGAGPTQTKTYVVRYTFTLYPRIYGLAATDDLAIFPPTITAIGGC